MIRPSVMYIDAANSAGPNKIRRDCMMNGPRASLSECDRARPMYPIVSKQPPITKGTQNQDRVADHAVDVSGSKDAKDHSGNGGSREGGNIAV